MEEKLKEVEAELLEKLADLEHQQWWTWSQHVASQNNLRIETIERWKKLWMPYRNLSEEMKEHDRQLARKVLEIIKKYPHIGFICMQQIDYELSDEEREMARELSSVFR